MSWWYPGCPFNDRAGIIADGSIRAGKTFPMSQSFIEWAFHNYDDQAFGMAGKTVGAFHRNVWFWLKPWLVRRGYTVIKIPPPLNGYAISRKGKTNVFYIFGGRDESSQDLVQGVTLAGFYFDEVALMPESFVNQATGRCSVEGATYWFNCNPDSPSHWFKLTWLDKHREKDLLHIHFNMADNPSLSDAVRAKYAKMYTGVFYKRFILGLWVMAQGAIYDMFEDDNLYDDDAILPGTRSNASHYIAIDYGTQNATRFLHIIDDGKNVWVDDEYYHSGRDAENTQKTDSQYADDFDAFVEHKPIIASIIDPAAASFKVELIQRGHIIIDADNEVLDGIRLTGTLFARKILKIHKRCVHLIREIQSYVWDPKPTDKGKEKPLKKDDHGCFSAETLVETPFGPCAISEIKAGNKILTPFGWQVVLKAECMGLKRTFKYHLNDDTYIISTSDHPFYSPNKGFLPISFCDTISKRIIERQNIWNPLFLMASVITGMAAIIILLVDVLRDISGYMWRFGKQGMVLFLKAFTFIIAIMIEKIIRSKILKRFLGKNIYRTMGKRLPQPEKPLLKKLRKPLKNGINQMLAWHGIANKENYHGKIGKPNLNTIASSVKKNFLPALIAPRIARIIASRLIDAELAGTWLINYVLFARKNSKLINLFHSKHVVVNVVEKCEVDRRLVYNIAVSGGCFYANGALVSNCDALRYWVKTIFQTWRLMEDAA